MTNMFKKTLVATAVLAVAGVAQAGTVASTEDSVTSQYLASTSVASGGAPNEHRANDVTVTLGAEYTSNDTFTLTFTSKLNSDLPSTLVGAPDDNTLSVSDLLGVTFSKLSGGNAGDTTVTYRLTATSTTGLDDTNNDPGFTTPVTTGQVLTIPAANLDFLKADLAAGVKVSFSAATNNGAVMDTGGGDNRTASLAKVIKQFTTTAPSFSRVVDVEAQRLSFVDLDNGNAGDLKVTGTFNIASQTTAGNVFARPLAAAEAVTHTLYGDFSWIVDTDEDADDIQPEAGVIDVANCANSDLTVEATQITLVCDAISTTTSITIDPEANKTNLEEDEYPVLPKQTFTATSEVTFTGPAGEEKVFDAVSAGSWTLNGSSINIPYMPYGTGITQVINLNNSGKQTGDITVEGFDRTGKKFGPVKVGTAAAGKQVALADAIATVVTGAVGASERVSLTLVTNVPDSDVTVYSAYNTGGNGARLVVNDSNGK